MSHEINSTELPEQVLAQAISPEKKQELIDRLTKLKSTLSQVESRMAVQEKSQVELPQKEKIVQELDRRMEILHLIAEETRANIQTVLQMQLGEKYPPQLQNMLKNLDKVNGAYGMILDGLIS